MKLLFCPDCWDLFKLTLKLRSCACGKVKGKYLNVKEAVSNGQGVSLGLDNLRLVQGIRKLATIEQGTCLLPDWDGISKDTGVTCWVRPHDGPLNPHCTVDPNLRDDHE